jgi:hypothetical protein
MAPLDPPNTRDDALALLLDIARDPGLGERFPDGSALIASDDPYFSELVTEAIDDRRRVVVVLPGNHYFVLAGRRSESLTGELHLAHA